MTSEEKNEIVKEVNKIFLANDWSDKMEILIERNKSVIFELLNLKKSKIFSDDILNKIKNNCNNIEFIKNIMDCYDSYGFFLLPDDIQLNYLSELKDSNQIYIIDSDLEKLKKSDDIKAILISVKYIINHNTESSINNDKIEYLHYILKKYHLSPIDLLKINPFLIDIPDFQVKENYNYIISNIENNQYYINKCTPIILRENVLVIAKSILKKSSSLFFIDFNNLSQNEKNEITDILRNTNNYVLNAVAPNFLKENFNIIMNSIDTNANSIDFAILDQLSNDQKYKLLLKIEQSGNYILNNSSLDLFKENFRIIKYNINFNPDSINFVNTDKLTEKEINALVDLVRLNKDYILDARSSVIYKSNFDIIINSIDNDIQSVDFVCFEKLSSKQIDSIFKLIMDKYILNANSNSFLKSNFNIVLSSISRNIKSIKFANLSNFNKDELFKILVVLKQNKVPFDKLKKYYDLFFCDNSLNVDKLSNVINLSSYIKWNSLEEYHRLFARIIGYLDSINIENTFIDDITKKISVKLNINVNDLYYLYENYINSVGKMKSDIKDKLCKLITLYINKEKADFYSNNYRNNINLLINKGVLKLKESVILNAYIDLNKYNVLNDNLDMYINDILKLNSNISYKEVERYLLEGSLEDYERYINYKLIRSLNSFLNKTINPKIINNKKLALIITKFIQGDCLTNEEVMILKKQKINNLLTKFKKELSKISCNNLLYDYKNNKFYIDISNLSILKNKEECQLFENKKCFLQKQKNRILKLISNQLKEKFSCINQEKINNLFKQFDFTTDLDNYNIVNYPETNLINIFDVICNIDSNIFLSDECFNLVKKYFSKYSLVTILNLNICKPNVFVSIIDNISKIDNNIIKKHNKDNEINELIFIYNRALNYLYSDDFSQSLIGEENIYKIISDNSYINANDKEIVKRKRVSNSVDLMRGMLKRENSTVPYVNGKINGINYKTIDYHDPWLMVSGIDCDCCFKILGIANDFLHYCALNKNGFVVRFDDEVGRLLGKVSGFRNGNIVFFNQFNKTKSVKNDDLIVLQKLEKALEVVAKKIIEISSIKEVKPIEYVLISKSGILVDSKLPELDFLIFKPIDNQSIDFKNWLNNTPNLIDRNIGFATEISVSSLLQLAILDESNKFAKKNITIFDAEPIYGRNINDFVFTEIIDESIVQKLNHLIACSCLIGNDVEVEMKRRDFTKIDINNIKKVYIGDDWYIVILNDENIIYDCISLNPISLEQYKLQLDKVLSVNNTEIKVKKIINKK